ncbi:TetR/AcrR family transcriptional regulator [Aliivibrio finisterrensis]|uniref:TetR/AcrR family transcriptional regulator n=1 Tax=Aliivibrio finisterrensis TaxID=511998 RepID=UPI00101ED5FA|nr:TetR/AcrR family transcriptional regulator [Aliivibrio finisterrensis]RYU65759.1 TetR/AcrR family transcriptional regulator [Aliivibrio finisterrensis]RYU69219.1 TetR/AcrR family transcriptional regulator [Aliivibrio finisterrensis]RYU72640.1 TetR/AcrR family transcriptional regulator [Aliivibrio finisterrensis]
MKAPKKISKKEVILLAAKDAFRKNGVDKTSMDTLAALANVSKSTVYNYFSSKEELVIELLGDLWRESMEHAENNISNKGDIKTQLEHLLLSEINLVTSEEYLNLSKVSIGYFLYRSGGDREKECLQNMLKKETVLLRWLQKMIDSKQLFIENKYHAECQLQSLICNPAYWCQAIGIKPLLTDNEKLQLAKRTADLFLSYYQKPNSSECLN